MNKIICSFVYLLLHIHTAYAQTELFAYITNAAAPSHVSVCRIHPDTGQFETCEPAYLENLSAPIGLALATIDHTTYAYISNNTYPNFVLRCRVNAEHLEGCGLTDVPSYTGIAIHKSDDHYAYLAYSDSVEKCRISAKGELARHDCHDSGAGRIFANGPIFMRFLTLNQENYVYIANGDYQPNASVTRCRVDAQGDFTACKDSGAGASFNGAADIDFAFIAGKTYAYITEPTGVIKKCILNDYTGLLNECAATGKGFHAPLGLSIITLENKLYAYVVDGGFRAPVANLVYHCKVDNSGDLDCGDSGVGPVFSNPFDIALLDRCAPGKCGFF